MSLLERDQKVIWHPFTQAQTARLPLPIAEGRGSYVIDTEGKRYLDMISSWWTNIHGHGHEELITTMAEQARQLDHVLFGGVTHEPAVQLAEKLLSLLPPSFSRCFYSDNGSTAIETAIKAAYQFWKNQGQEKPFFIGFDGGYHGDTMGAMSVSHIPAFHNTFEQLRFKTLTAPYPDTWDGDQDVELKEQKSLDALEDLFQQYRFKISALILEPLVQGAQGMRMARPSWVNQVLCLAKSFGVLVIFDEVMTGFYRTGTLFAINQLEETPDIVCLAKGLSGGILPLAVTVFTEELYKGFLSTEFEKALMHGHTFTAYPIGCKVALKSLEILQREETQKNIQTLVQTHNVRLKKLNHSHKRQTGTIAAFEVETPLKLQDTLLDSGIMTRPLGNVMYLFPPYSVTETELNRVYDVIEYS